MLQEEEVGWNASHHAEDALSVDLLIHELWKESYDPVLLYKTQGIVGPNIPTIAEDDSLLHCKLNFNEMYIDNMDIK